VIFEVTFWIAFVLASRAIAKIYYRRRDVLYGPYRATAPTNALFMQRSSRKDLSPTKKRRTVNRALVENRD
jgi:hypothetical protein